jgi:hypothetical protein
VPSRHHDSQPDLIWPPTATPPLLSTTAPHGAMVLFSVG